MEKRGYWEIISETEPETPTYVLKNLPPELYDARLPLREMKSKPQIWGLTTFRQGRKGLRMAFAGGWIVNRFIFLLIIFWSPTSLGD